MSYDSPIYDLGNEISNESTLKGSPIYGDLYKLFDTHGGMKEILNSLPGAGKQAYFAITDAVMKRTFLKWGKPFECIRVRQILRGMEESNLRPVDLSERTIRRGLHSLCSHGILVKFASKDGCDCFYAFNVGEIMRRMKCSVESLKKNCVESIRYRELYKFVTESEDYRKLVKIINYFAGEVIDDIVKFKERISELMCAVLRNVAEVQARTANAVQTAAATACHAVQNVGRTVVANLAQNVANAKNAAREVANRRQNSIAGRTILNEKTGFVDAAAGVALWHKEVRDADCYRGYVEKTTSKVNGMMKNWLKELKAQGYDEPGIRDLIKSCVQGWEGTVRSQKKIPGVSKTGKPYQTTMVQTPDFEFYYAHRTALTPMLISWSTQAFLAYRPQGASAGGRGDVGNGVYGYGFF
jgi:hypothetical protein